MEYEGFKRTMDFLLRELDISTLVSDRHQTIAKHMREKLPNITHYFNIWHLKKISSYKSCMIMHLGNYTLRLQAHAYRITTIASHIVYKNVLHRQLLTIPTSILSELKKVLSKLVKEEDCTELAEWVQPCINHLYWSATSTHSGNGRIILAKFKSFLSHVVDKHTDLDDPLYNKCAHDELMPRKWILPGMFCFTIVTPQ